MGGFSYVLLNPSRAELAISFLSLPDMADLSPVQSLPRLQAGIAAGNTAAVFVLREQGGTQAPAALFLADLCRGNGLACAHQYISRDSRGESFAISRGAVDFFTHEIWPDCRGIVGMVPDLPQFRRSGFAAAGMGAERAGRIKGFFRIGGTAADAILYQIPITHPPRIQP